LVVGGIYSLVALSFAIIYKTIRFFHFAHGSVIVAGAYIAYSLSCFVGIPLLLSIVVSSLITTVLGIVIYKTTYSYLRVIGSSNLILAITSFGIFIFIQNLFQILYGAQILSLKTGPVSEGHLIMGGTITNVQISIIVISCLLLVLIRSVVVETRIGKAIRAVADDPLGASISGINPERIIIYSFGIGSALAGLSGGLISLESSIEPTMGLNLILKGIIASIIGGLGSIPGAVLGGFFLGIVENLGIWKIQAGWKDTISFAVLIAFLLFRPEGILGKRTDRENL